MPFRVKKIHYFVFFAIIIIFVLMIVLSTLNFGNDKNIIWGVTFSIKQCRDLGLGWPGIFLKVINELPIKVVRLPVYWDEVEYAKGQFDFSSYHWLIAEAEKRGIEIMPVLGRRVPRWPECHQPGFYSFLPENMIQPKILNFLKQEILEFKKYSNIKKWQLDNEPFLGVFGDCPPPDENFIKQEIALVKQLDRRPVVITESGELSSWLKGAKLADILGVSMYRQTWNRKWGYFTYPLAPAYYYFKAALIKLLTSVKEVINTELQVEPWSINHNLKAMTLFDQFYSIDLPQIKQNIKFAKRAGLKEVYLWGVEWWWWLGEKHGHWEFWEYGKTIH